MRLTAVVGGLVGLAVLAGAGASAARPLRPAPVAPQAANPIQHIVIVDEENHSFNDLLGKFCVDQASGQIVRAGVNDGCTGTDVGTLQSGASIALSSEPNGGLNVNHSIHGQQVAIDGGKMDGFSKTGGCTSQSNPAYGCYTQFDPLGG